MNSKSYQNDHKTQPFPSDGRSEWIRKVTRAIRPVGKRLAEKRTGLLQRPFNLEDWCFVLRMPALPRFRRLCSPRRKHPSGIFLWCRLFTQLPSITLSTPLRGIIREKCTHTEKTRRERAARALSLVLYIYYGAGCSIVGLCYWGVGLGPDIF